MKSNGLERQLAWLGGLGIGAALMYFLDPKRGARRRHVVQDRAGRATRATGWHMRKAAENVKNHGLGAVRELGGRVRERLRGVRVPHKLHEVVRAAARVRGVRQVRNRLGDGGGS